MCPFLSYEGPCPYGLACRFAGTHRDNNGEVAAVNVDKINGETNVMKKDVQKLLWKNKMKFPKADAVLKLLGLQVRRTLFALDKYGRVSVFKLRFCFSVSIFSVYGFFISII